MTNERAHKVRLREPAAHDLKDSAPYWANPTHSRRAPHLPRLSTRERKALLNLARKISGILGRDCRVWSSTTRDYSVKHEEAQVALKCLRSYPAVCDDGVPRDPAINHLIDSFEQAFPGLA